MWDPEGKTKVGDILMIRPLKDRFSVHINATHEFEDILFPAGYIIDPVSGRRCRGLQYAESNEIQTYSEMKVKPWGNEVKYVTLEFSVSTVYLKLSLIICVFTQYKIY